MQFKSFDTYFMKRAVVLAKNGIYTTSPNPNVGCVVVKNKIIVGYGYHSKAGDLHAEIYALQMAGDNAVGADLYVTLEPCCHFGKTPPCVNEIIKFGIKRVIIGMSDPYKEVYGNGIKKLLESGIMVTTGIMENIVQELNLGFISRITKNKPWVTLKIGSSLDGKLGLLDGQSQWITSIASRRDVHKLRAKTDVIITGSNTVKIDNPCMNIRDCNFGINPCRVIIDSKLQTMPQSNIYKKNARVILATNILDNNKLQPFMKQNVEIWNNISNYSHNNIDLQKLLINLANEKYNYVLIEGGMNLNAAFLSQGLIDEIIVYISPTIIGNQAVGMFNLPELKVLEQKFKFSFNHIKKIGCDIRLTLRKN